MLTESNSSLQQKIDEIYASNVVVAKKGSTQPAHPGRNAEAGFMTRVQDEIRKLHQQLQRKEHVINQLKFLVGKQQNQNMAQPEQVEQEAESPTSFAHSLTSQKSADDEARPQTVHDSYKATKERLNLVRGSMFVGGPRQSIKLNKSLASEMQDILGADLVDDATLCDKTIEDIMSSKTRKATEGELEQITISSIIAADDLKRYLCNHNELVKSVDTFETENKHLKQMVESLKAAMDQQLGKSPDLQKMAEAKISLGLQDQKKEFDLERRTFQMLAEQKDRQLKELEQEAAEQKEMCAQLRNAVSADDAKRKEKTQTLEQHLDKLHQMFQQVNNDREMLKLNATTAQKKLASKDERVKKLESQLEAARQKQQNLLNVIKQLKEEFTKAQKTLALGLRDRAETFLPGSAATNTILGRRHTLMGGGPALRGGNKQ